MKTAHDQIKEALKEAITGILWWHDEYPEASSDVDHEKVAELQQALALLETHAVVPRELTAENGLNELIAVIEGHFNYLERRRALSEISGVDCMAITTDEHIKAIRGIVVAQNARIKELEGKIDAMIAAAVRGE